ncbi:hypothetical protein G5V57_19085 [Nordella sp. HKS 07]|uniref:hypothetical protein n=1 Tax=Nordella sp. HKS 07 TaxID=2712222 RepID=UPI0013E1B8D2|nr:hypothetical protein [Nordella sp. HKS 07]QIG49632.1 hypothetical protein G5V57_19085 [Nordella sp. HKS 07]
MSHVAYIGSGPYCYANSFAMMFGAGAPSPAVIEFATDSPFGVHLIGGTLPFFDPYGWTPEAGFDEALAAMGWRSQVSSGGTEAEALARLRCALAQGPVWIGPVEMGHLRHQPKMTGPIGADHYVVVLEADDRQVVMHDPQGYPYASLPLADFMTAWRAETVSYGSPYTLRSGFVRERRVSEEEVIQASIPANLEWLAMQRGDGMPPGSLGNGEAALALAAMVDAGPDEELRSHLIHFAIRVGARRAADAATCLARIGLTEASRIADRQARLIGSMQHPLAAGDRRDAAAALRGLASTYVELLTALASFSAAVS